MDLKSGRHRRLAIEWNGFVEFAHNQFRCTFRRVKAHRHERCKNICAFERNVMYWIWLASHKLYYVNHLNKTCPSVGLWLWTRSVCVWNSCKGITKCCKCCANTCGTDNSTSTDTQCEAKSITLHWDAITYVHVHCAPCSSIKVLINRYYRDRNTLSPRFQWGATKSGDVTCKIVKKLYHVWCVTIFLPHLLGNLHFAITHTEVAVFMATRATPFAISCVRVDDDDGVHHTNL